MPLGPNDIPLDALIQAFPTEEAAFRGYMQTPIECRHGVVARRLPSSRPIRTRVGVIGEACYARNRPVALAAAEACGAALEGVPARVEAEELAEKAQRLDRVLSEIARLADRKQLAEEDRVAGVAGAADLRAIGRIGGRSLVTFVLLLIGTVITTLVDRRGR